MDHYTLHNEEINRVLLMCKHKLFLPPVGDHSKDNTHIVLSMMMNMEDLGFIFSQDLFEILRFQPAKSLADLYGQIIPILKEMVSAHVRHVPFYRNFPDQMGSMSELEIYLNALVHYWTIGEWKPKYPVEQRFPLQDGHPQIRMIQPGGLDDLEDIFLHMISAKGSLSDKDRKLLGWFIQKSDPDLLASSLPEVIPSKETLSIVAGSIMQYHPGNSEILSNYFKTATDVLRLALSLSGGDVSLAENSRFRSFKRSERKFLLNLINQAGNIEEDIVRYKGVWLRLGEKLHPGDYAEEYPVAFEAFWKIRNNVKISTFSSRVETALKNGEVAGALQLLRNRAGELARKLDFLLRSYPGCTEEVIDSFEEVSFKISSQVLLQVMAHFKNRSIEKTYRSFFPKGNVSKVQVVEKSLPTLPNETCQRIVSICERELEKQFSTRDALGKVFIDPVLADVIAPLAQRAASKSLKTYARGSRFKIGENTNTVRAFIHWKNIMISRPGIDPSGSKRDYVGDQDMGWVGEELVYERNEIVGKEKSIRTDIDLSLGLFDNDWNFVEQVSYTNIRSNLFSGLYHSGDIVNAPEGATEFIDMDLNVLRENGIRYAVFNVYSYTRQSYNEIPECFFGWMERENPGSGEVFEPRTVRNKADLTSETTICLPVLFDLKEMKFIWLDLALKSNQYWVNDIHGNLTNIALMARAMVDLSKPNLYDLFRLNAKARGEIVDIPEDADIKFGLDEEKDDVTPFQVERILSDFL